MSVLPTTTIDSFPQTTDIRKARAAHVEDTLSGADYRARIEREIAEVVTPQEKLGLNVLAHGEAECNDMAQYFAKFPNGFIAIRNGWVQSYGSRCTCLSILWGDVARPRAMTVDWAAFTQSLTDEPVRGILTGPVTIIAWPFLRNGLGLAEVADQIGFTLRDEVEDLKAAGIVIIQVNESALREPLPLNAEDHADYLRWLVDSFRVATTGVRPNAQIRTHLRYSEFGWIIDAIAALDANVTSIEAAHSCMKVFPELAEAGSDHGIGSSVWDTHSLCILSAEEIRSLIDVALGATPAKHPWVNPDYGLKTRGYEEIPVSLSHLVEATKEAREAF